MKSSGITFNASKRSSGRIVVVRSPAIEGAENTFTFASLDEMKAALGLDHDEIDIERIADDLEDFGSVEFTVSHLNR